MSLKLGPKLDQVHRVTSDLEQPASKSLDNKGEKYKKNAYIEITIFGKKGSQTYIFEVRYRSVICYIVE